MLIHDFKQNIIENMYLDSDDVTIRRKVDGYYNRYKKHDIVKPFINKEGYHTLQIPKARRVIKMAHIYLLLRKQLPSGDFMVDHINGDRLDDSRANLRIVNARTNCCNRCKRSDNSSGITGIRWSDYHNHYVIRKTVFGKRYSRSSKTLEQAKIILEELISMDKTYTKRHGK